MRYEPVSWYIRAIRPLMFNRHAIEGDPSKPTGRKRKIEAAPVDTEKVRYEEARTKLHVDDQARCIIPVAMFWSALMDGCEDVWLRMTVEGRSKPTRRPLPDLLAHAVTVPDEEGCPMYDPDTLMDKRPRLLTAKDWRVDVRWIQALTRDKTPAAVLTARPKFLRWGCILTLLVDRDQFSDVHALDELTVGLNRAGQLGIGSGRMRRVEVGGKRFVKPLWKGINMGKFWAELVT
jgi:hypothetical protein